MTTASKKTLNGFFAQSSNPHFFIKVWEAGGLDFSEVEKNPSDFYSANTCMTHFADTEKFARKHLEDILDILTEYDQETITDTFTRSLESGNTLNFFACLAWGFMMKEMISYLEN